jgi:ectoine hydroxylase-related dioxygenase (phytanoyl-CoA dioxygenase family)
MVDPTRSVAFRERGYFVVPAVFSAAEATEILGEVQRAKVRSDANGDALTRDRMEFRGNLFFESEALQRLAADQRIIDLLTPIGGDDLWVRWDQAVGKSPGAGVFPWHQDNAYNRLLDEHFQVWIALTEMRADNGSLWLVPEPAHRRRALPHDEVGPDLVYSGHVGESTMIGARAGDVVVFSSRMLHMTTPNTSDDVRWAYVLEYMRMADIDPFVSGPRFVVARGGRSTPGFVDELGSEQTIRNRVRYSGPALAGRHLARKVGDRRRSLSRREPDRVPQLI